jgi:hypothetical protein
MPKASNPRLEVQITPENWERAVRSSSGGCLIADAIKEQYPQFSHVVVDMATIRVTDREAGNRYIYLSPDEAQHLLLAYDQGWSQPFDRVRTRKPVQIVPITRTQSGSQSETRRREASALRRAELEGKEARGEEMTPSEKASLTRLRNPKPRSARPRAEGVVKVSGKNRNTTIHGGRPLMQGDPHPNLLRGRDRHFGAKMSQPGLAFEEAVEAAVAEKMAAEKA